MSNHSLIKRSLSPSSEWVTSLKIGNKTPLKINSHNDGEKSEPEKFNISNLSDAATELFIQITGISSLELINKKIEKSLKINSKLIYKLMSKL